MFGASSGGRKAFGDPASSRQVEFHLISAIDRPGVIVLATEFGGEFPGVAVNSNDAPGIDPAHGIKKAGEVCVI